MIQLKKGDKLSETQYYIVETVDKDLIQLVNDSGDPITVDREYAERCLISAHHFSKELQMSKTEIANLFISATNTALTVNYNKQLNHKEVKAQLYELYPNKGGKILSEADYKKKVSIALVSALDGEERTMIGRHYGQKDEFGRIRFIDMEQAKDNNKDYDTRQRLVDTRTINWLILNGIKYVTK